METVLASWMKQSDEVTLGDIDSFGGSPVITVSVRSDEFVINRDTKRAAIESFLQAAAGAGGVAGLDWHDETRPERTETTLHQDLRRERPAYGWCPHKLPKLRTRVRFSSPALAR